MKTKIIKILKKYTTNFSVDNINVGDGVSDVNFDNVAAEIVNLINKKEEEEIEQPILVGHLNKIFGFNGFNTVEIGTPVYHYQGSFFFEQTPLKGGNPVRVKYNIQTLTPCINFI